MAVDPKKILRGLEVEGETTLKKPATLKETLTIEGETTAQKPVTIEFADATDTSDGLIVNEKTALNDVVTITAIDPDDIDAPVLIVDGIIQNRQFFPLNKLGTENITVKVNEGITIERTGSITRYFVNRSDSDIVIAPTVTAPELNQLVRDKTLGEWFDESCTIDHNFFTAEIVWNNDDGSTSSQERLWSQTNGGMTWTISSPGADIVELCNNELVTPLPIKEVIPPKIEFTSATRTNPDGSVTIVTNDFDPSTPNYPLTLTYPVSLVNPNLTDDNTYTFTGSFIDTETEELVTGVMGSITYLAPQASLSVTIAPTLFDVQYVMATITRIFETGAPTSTISTTLGGTSIPITDTITFAFDRATTESERQLVEITSYTNAAPADPANPDIIQLTRSADVYPEFLFPFYLGSVTTTNGFDKAAANAIVAQSDSAGNTGTVVSSIPNTFVWPDIENNAANIKIFGIRTADLPNGVNTELRFKANPASGFGIENRRFTNLSIGRIDKTNALEDYSFFIAQMGQPGTTSLYVEVV